MFDPRRLAFAQAQLPAMAQEREQMLGLLAPLFRAQQGTGLLGQPWPAQEGAAPPPQVGGLLAPAMPADVPAPGAMPTAGAVTPAAPPMAGSPRDHEAQLAQAAAGAAPAATQQPSGWERFSQALGDNSDLLMGLGAGIMSAPTWSEGAARGLQQGQKAQLLGDQGRLQKAKLQQQQGSLTANAQLIKKAYGVLDEEAKGLATNTAAVSEALKRLSPSEQFKQETDPDGSIWQTNTLTGGRQLLRQPRETDTADMKNFEAAKAGGFAGTFMDFQREAKRPLVNIEQKAQAAGDAKAEGAIVERLDAISKDGDAARSDLAIIGELRDLQRRIPTGWEASAKARLGEYGIKLDGVSDIEAFQSFIDRLTPQQRVPGSGATSDFEMKTFKSSLPSLMRTPDGNKIIFDTMEALTRDKGERATIANQALTGEISRKDALKQLQNRADPMTAFNAWRGKQSGSDDRSSSADPLSQARNAIAKGAPRDAVIQRLRQSGIDPAGL